MNTLSIQHFCSLCDSQLTAAEVHYYGRAVQVCDSCAQTVFRLYSDWHEGTHFMNVTSRPINRGAPISEKKRWDIYERDGFVCRNCGANKLLTIDHIIPVSKGGRNHPDNYQTLCRSCNSKKGSQ